MQVIRRYRKRPLVPSSGAPLSEGREGGERFPTPSHRSSGITLCTDVGKTLTTLTTLTGSRPLVRSWRTTRPICAVLSHSVGCSLFEQIRRSVRLLAVVDGSSEVFQPLPACRLVNPTLGFVRCNSVGVSRCSAHDPDSWSRSCPRHRRAGARSRSRKHVATHLLAT